MKKVAVYLPITGIAYVEVEVEDNATQDEIYTSATSVVDFRGLSEITTNGEYQEVCLNTLKEITTGNVFHGELNEMYWEEIDE
jgi:hypothetical protein